MEDGNIVTKDDGCLISPGRRPTQEQETAQHNDSHGDLNPTISEIQAQHDTCSLDRAAEDDRTPMHEELKKDLTSSDVKKDLSEEIPDGHVTHDLAAAEPTALAVEMPCSRDESVYGTNLSTAPAAKNATGLGTTSVVLDHAEEGPRLQLSKKQLKRLAKREAIAASKAARKEEKKERKRQEAEERKASKAAELANLPEELLEKLKQERRDRIKMMKEETFALKQRSQRALVEGQRVIIDLGFGTYMRDGEVRSLCKQVQYSYSHSIKAQKPAHLILTSCTDRIKDRMDATCSGYNRWPISVYEQCYSEVFDGKLEELVYLTPDSHNIVENLDPAKAYIVGGLVDRNRHKGVCFEKAVSQESKDWGAALRAVVPPRKVAKRCAPDVIVPPNSVPPAKKPCCINEGAIEVSRPADDQDTDC